MNKNTKLLIAAALVSGLVAGQTAIASDNSQATKKPAQKGKAKCAGGSCPTKAEKASCEGKDQGSCKGKKVKKEGECKAEGSCERKE